MVYNIYPWPSVTDKQKVNIENLAQTVLNIRMKYSQSTLADLYDPISMPAELVKAHENLNRAVDIAYGKISFKNEAERVGFLFNKYLEQINTIEMIPEETRVKHKESDLRLFGGLPGTGKTTISQQIAKQLNAVYRDFAAKKH